MQELIDDKIKEQIKLILSARFIDFKVRKDGKEYVFEGDFIKSIIYKSEYFNQTYKEVTALENKA